MDLWILTKNGTKNVGSKRENFKNACEEVWEKQTKIILFDKWESHLERYQKYLIREHKRRYIYFKYTDII